MTITEAQNTLHDIVANYFGSGHVFFADAKAAKRPEPYVTIKFRGFGKTSSVSKDVLTDEYEHTYSIINAHVDLNLYTRGKNISGYNADPVYMNTALNDLNSFVSYLDSDGAIEEMDRKNVSIVVTSEVNDLSALQKNSTSYQYRAMVGLDMNFIVEDYGLYGLNGKDHIPDDSNGGRSYLISEPYVIEQINIEEEFTE